MILGGFSAALTTPLDVAKTRIMLADSKSQESRGKILPVLRLVVSEKGLTGYNYFYITRHMAYFL